MALTVHLPEVPDTSKYSLGAVANILGVSRQTVYNWRDNAEIKVGFRKNGRRAAFVTGYEIKRFWKSQS